MDFLKKYLKQKSRIFCILLVFVAINAVVNKLFDLPSAALLYPIILCATVGVVFLAFDFSREYKNHRLLTEIKQNNAEIMSVPDICRTVTENDLKEIIDIIRADFTRTRADNDEHYRKATEYYTLWTHQIKTPISSMYLMLSSEDTQFSRSLQSELSRIERYAGMALTYQKLDSDSSDFVFKRHSLDKLIKKSVKSFSSEFIYRKLSFVYEETEKTVITDEKWFCFVLEQLLSNALKYTSHGSITITVDDNNVLCVADTGMGIAKEDLPRIFEQGYTGVNGRRDRSSSGIGLYLCREICKKLNIRFYAESEPDVGTRVYLDLSQYDLKVE